MTDKTDLIREIHEYVTTHGGENTATHLLVQAASAIQTQAAELEAVGAGGVQALSAAPASPWSRALEIRIAQGWKLKGDRLPVLYTDTINGEGVGRDDLWLCTTKALAASPTPPAEQHPPRCRYCDGTGDVHSGDGEWRGICTECEAGTALRQQAAPKAAPESFLDGADVQDESGVLAYYSREAVLACITAALESVAAPKAAPVSSDTLYLLRRLLSNQHTLTGPEFRAELEKIVGEAYQQEAQESYWEGAEEWEKLAWHLCAEENGEDACNELIWEGGPMPEPWGDRWLKYEGEARRMIALVRTHVPAPQQEAQERVYLVNTGEVRNGLEMYERHEKPVPLADFEVLYTAQPAPAPLSEMPYEKRKAIQEGEQISASDAWFHARLNMLDTLDRRNVFRAGFDRGWNAALAAQGGRDAG